MLTFFIILLSIYVYYVIVTACKLYLASSQLLRWSPQLIDQEHKNALLSQSCCMPCGVVIHEYGTVVDW